MSDTFIYENVEVRKTGRVAVRQLRSTKTEELIEITPVHTVVGAWYKWVREDTLYVVQSTNSKHVENSEDMLNMERFTGMAGY